jgi:hypothetical protein
MFTRTSSASPHHLPSFLEIPPYAIYAVIRAARPSLKRTSTPSSPATLEEILVRHINQHNKWQCIDSERRPNRHVSSMTVTFLNIPACCRIDILRLYLLKDRTVVVDPENYDAPGLLRICEKLRVEAMKVFLRG